MHRIDTATKVTDKFGSGKHGFREARPGNTTPLSGTITTAEIFDAWQEELATLIEDTDISLVKTDNAQIIKAAKDLSGLRFHLGNLAVQETVGDVIRAMVYDDNSSLWCAVGSTNGVETSPDGVTWTARTLDGTPGDMGSIAYDGTSRLCAASRSGSGEIQSSDDGGVTWTDRTGAVSESFFAIGHDGSALWVAIGDGSVVYTSADGATWGTTAHDAGTSVRSLDSDGSLWVAVNSGGTNAILSSTDAISWTSRQAGLTGYVDAVVKYGGGLWVYAGEGELYTSADGITWTAAASFPTGYDFVSLDYNTITGMWVATGESATGVGGAFISYTGTDWFAIDTMDAVNYSIATKGDYYLIAAGATGIIYKSAVLALVV